MSHFYKKGSFLRNNGLTLVLIVLFLGSLIGQIAMWRREYNSEQEDFGKQPVSLGTYLQKWHFIQSTFENWESEFLQMWLYVLLTVFLFQKWSSESKDPDKEEEVDREPKAHKDAPRPVKQWWFILSLYKYSLSIVFLILFLVSFIIHFRWSLANYNEEQQDKWQPQVTMSEYIGNENFRFESFQNRQSEFLAVIAIVLLSIRLRQKWSPESKPVDAPYSETWW